MLEEICVAVFDDEDDVEDESVGAGALDVVLDDVEEEYVEADALDVVLDDVEEEFVGAEALDDVVTVLLTVLLDEETCGAEGVAGGVALSAYATEVDAAINMKRRIGMNAERMQNTQIAERLGETRFALSKKTRLSIPMTLAKCDAKSNVKNTPTLGEKYPEGGGNGSDIFLKFLRGGY